MDSSPSTIRNAAPSLGPSIISKRRWQHHLSGPHITPNEEIERQRQSSAGMVQTRVTRVAEPHATSPGRKSHWLNCLMDCIARAHTHTTSFRCHPDGRTFEPGRNHCASQAQTPWAERCGPSAERRLRANSRHFLRTKILDESEKPLAARVLTARGRMPAALPAAPKPKRRLSLLDPVPVLA